MIGKLKGQVESVSGRTALIDVQGVGYEVHCTRNSISSFSAGSKAEIIIYTEVKQDHIRLYGFEDLHEKEVFLLLMQVKGIGPKSAADIISKVDKSELIRFIGRGDLTKLQAVKGIGKKTAERIIVELKDKIAEFAVERNYSNGLGVEMEIIEPANDALQALQALGFARKDAERAVSQVQLMPEFVKLNSGDIVKEALRYI